MMSITSVSYLLFVTISLFIYLNIATKYQWYILLIDSLLFYFVNAKPYTFVYLLISVFSVFIATQFFKKCKDDIKKKKMALLLTIILNVGILAVLKYTNLFIDTFNFFCKTDIVHVTWYSSLAVSFYTLQILAYLLDCYWNVEDVEDNPLKLLLFTSYFPLMISGPISMHHNLAQQLSIEHRFDYDRVTSGLRRVAWGMAKKVVVADRLSIVITQMFNNPDIYSGIWGLIAAIGFVVELYFDFSGCMDIVIGVSKCFGIELVENFNAPFMSRTVQEIWQRWHITLGAWLKSYIMYPLLKTDALVTIGSVCKKKFGKQGKKVPSYIAMLVVWLLMGLWHGNSWKYIIGEGLWFWLIIVLGQVLEPFFVNIKKYLHINESNIVWKTFQRLRTIILFSIGMIFFNATSLNAAFYMLKNLFKLTGFSTPLKELYANSWINFGGKISLIAVLFIFMVQVFSDIYMYKGGNAQDIIKSLPFVCRWLLYIVLIFCIILCGSFGQSSFIYFGF